MYTSIERFLHSPLYTENEEQPKLGARCSNSRGLGLLRMYVCVRVYVHACMRVYVRTPVRSTDSTYGQTTEEVAVHKRESPDTFFWRVPYV